MYQIISTISIIIRFILCWATIEKYPIFANENIQWIFWQIISIYTILRIITYSITNKKILKYWIKKSERKSAIYFIVYIPLIGITFWILRILTKTHILPL